MATASHVRITFRSSGDHYETMFTEKPVSKSEKNYSSENLRQRMVSETALMRALFPQIPVLSQVADKSKNAIEMENHCIFRLRVSAGNEQCLMPYGGKSNKNFAILEQASSPNLLNGVTDFVSF